MKGGVVSRAGRRLKGRLGWPLSVSVLTSLWLWFALVSPAYHRSALLRSRAGEVRALLAESPEQEPRHQELKRRLLQLELELQPWKERVWPAAGPSPLSYVDDAAGSAGVRIQDFGPVALDSGDGPPSWDCDIEGAFGPLLDFLGEMSRAPRMIDIRDLTIRPVANPSTSAPGLHLSLRLAVPSLEDFSP